MINIEQDLFRNIVDTLVEAFHEAQSYGPSDSDEHYINTIKEAKAVLGETYEYDKGNSRF